MFNQPALTTGSDVLGFDGEIGTLIQADHGRTPMGRTLDQLIHESLLEAERAAWQSDVLWPSVLAAAIVGGLLVFLVMKRLSVPRWRVAFLAALRARAWMLCRVVGAGLLVVGVLGVYAASRAHEAFEWWAVSAGMGSGMVAMTLSTQSRLSQRAASEKTDPGVYMPVGCASCAHVYVANRESQLEG